MRWSTYNRHEEIIEDHNFGAGPPDQQRFAKRFRLGAVRVCRLWELRPPFEEEREIVGRHILY